MPRKHLAFTLIELLVVIAIIAILAAILFPVFAKAREKARQSTCQSNMKQMGLAFMQYKQDYDETWPNNAYLLAGGAGSGSTYDGTYELWYTQLMPYMKNWQILECPSATAKTITSWSGGKPNYNWSSVYGWSAWQIGAGQYTLLSSVSDAQLTHPAESIVMGDTQQCYRMTGQLNYVSSDNDRPIDPRHNDGANFLFADGHVKFNKPSAVQYPDGNTRNAAFSL